MERFLTNSLIVFALIGCGLFRLCLLSTADGVPTECSADKLIVYRMVLHTFWTSSRFPKHYPQWRPPAQWSTLIGKCIRGNRNLFYVKTSNEFWFDRWVISSFQGYFFFRWLMAICTYLRISYGGKLVSLKLWFCVKFNIIRCISLSLSIK